MYSNENLASWRQLVEQIKRVGLVVPQLVGTVAELQSLFIYKYKYKYKKEIQRQIQKRNIEQLAVRGQWSSCPVLVESSQKRFLTFPPLLQPTGFAEFDCTCNYSEFEFISSSSNTNTKEVFDL